MAVISVEPVGSRSSGIGSDFVRTYTLVYRVVTDNRLNAGYVARTAVPFSIADSYVFGAEYDTGAYCVDISASEDQAGEGKVWLVTCQFDRLPPTAENPLNRPYRYAWDGQNIEQPYNIDVLGKAVCNTVGDPFTTQLVRSVARPVLSITRNEQSFNTALALFCNTTNSDIFFGGAPGTVLFLPPQTSSQTDPTIGLYYETTYNFSYNPDGWADHVWNMGTRERNIRRVLKPIVINGVPVTDPVPLTWGGQILPANAPPVELKFEPYNRMPFSILGLS